MKAKHLLRDRADHSDAGVNFAELFFDLVFVFAVTQISHTLLAHLDAAHAVQSALLILAVWSVWIYTTWATSWLHAEHGSVRLMLFIVMGAGLVVSTSLPDAFGERGLVFAGAYIFMHAVRGLFLVLALRGRNAKAALNFTRIQIWLTASGALWIAGGLDDPARRPFWWAAALALEFGGPWVGFRVPVLGASTTADWDVSAHHMAERCGLFMIIALGESVLVLGAAFADLSWTPETVGAFAIGFAGTVALWWIYFLSAEEARETFSESRDRGQLARSAYTYCHIPMVAGVIVAAVADELVLAHPGGHLTMPALICLTGGPALFLLGSALFARIFCVRLPMSHIGGFAGLAVIALAAPAMTPLNAAMGVLAVLVGVALWETVRLSRETRRNAEDAASPHASRGGGPGAV